MRTTPKIPRNASLGALVVVAIAAALTGCRSASIHRPVVRVRNGEKVPTIMKTEANDALRKMGERKKELYPNRKIIFTLDVEKVKGLPADAPDLTGLLESAFAELAGTDMFFVPKSTLENLLLAPALPAVYLQPDGSDPEFIIMRITAYQDKQVMSKGKGASLQLLLEQKGIYIQPEAEMEVEDEISTLVVSVVAQDPVTGSLSRAKADLSADLYRKRNANKLAMLVAGSGVNYQQQLLIVDGMGESLSSMLSRTMLVFISRAVGIDYWRTDFGGEADEEVYRAFNEMPEKMRVDAGLSMLNSLGYGSSTVDSGVAQFRAQRGLPAGVSLDPETLCQLMAASGMKVPASQPSEEILLNLTRVASAGLRERARQAVWSTSGVVAVTKSGQPDKEEYTVQLRGDAHAIESGIRAVLLASYDLRWDESGKRRVLSAVPRSGGN